MSKAVADLAAKYYPTLWPLERLDALKEAGRLTAEEYSAAVGSGTEAAT